MKSIPYDEMAVLYNGRGSYAVDIVAECRLDGRAGGNGSTAPRMALLCKICMMRGVSRETLRAPIVDFKRVFATQSRDTAQVLCARRFDAVAPRQLVKPLCP
jgi:hypothetical protein